MRKTVIFLLILTIPIGFLLGAHKAIGALGDDVQITLIDAYGDGERIEGKRIRLLTTCGEHMWWYTDHTLGGETQTQFHFSQEEQSFHEKAYQWFGFSLTSAASMGVYTSGGNGFRFDDVGMGRILNAVASRTEPGQTREETVLLEDYLDYYPLEYQADIQTERYSINESYSMTQHITSNEGGTYGLEKEDYGMCQDWMDRFRFPIQPGHAVKVSITRDEGGAVRDAGINVEGGSNAACVDFINYIAEEGMYFSPVFQYGDGTPILTGEFPEGYGLYYIPYQPLESSVIFDENKMTEATFDYDALELVYPLDPADTLVAMEASADGSALHLLTRENGTYFYSLLDFQSRRVVTKVEIMEGENGPGYCFYPEQELLLVRTSGRAALVKLGEEARMEFAAPWPEDLAYSPPESVLYEDGVLYGAGLEYHEQEYALCLTVFDSGGLAYCGYYSTNLNYASNYSGSAYVQRETVEFITSDSPFKPGGRMPWRS